MMLITTLVVSICKDGGGSVNEKLWFLVVYFQCEVLCCFVVADNVFLLILIVVPETCLACKKYNNIISGIWLVLIYQLSQ